MTDHVKCMTTNIIQVHAASKTAQKNFLVWNFTAVQISNLAKITGF
jgi:hypothetical protein